jgi:hypothetical protein
LASTEGASLSSVRFFSLERTLRSRVLTFLRHIFRELPNKDGGQIAQPRLEDGHVILFWNSAYYSIKVYYSSVGTSQSTLSDTSPEISNSPKEPRTNKQHNTCSGTRECNQSARSAELSIAFQWRKRRSFVNCYCYVFWVPLPFLNSPYH